MTYEKLLLLPVFAHVAMILASVFWLGFSRVAAVRRGDVKVKDIALDSENWPDELRKRANNYRNQFELPVLFYALVAFVLAMNLAGPVELILAWIFVLTRFVHSYIHTGTNYVRHRFYAFASSAFTLTLMWAWFAVRVLAGGG
ncbi:MAG TPA: MAPEG family protein [Aestuariivirgaceae bacterium]|nr:MAPEG family protein [Aestuariivirgaceae bacterium]